MKSFLQTFFPEVQEIQPPKGKTLPCGQWRNLGQNRFELTAWAHTPKEAQDAFAKMLRALSLQSHARVLNTGTHDATSQQRGGELLHGVRSTFQIY